MRGVPTDSSVRGAAGAQAALAGGGRAKVEESDGRQKRQAKGEREEGEANRRDCIIKYVECYCSNRASYARFLKDD